MDWLELHFDDDPETLRAALAVIDGVNASILTVVESSGEQSTAHSDASESPDDKRDRDEQRDQGDPSLSSVTMEDLTHELVWKDVALRQRKHRRDVETENEKLRSMLRAQTLVGQQLLHLLQLTALHEDQRAAPHDGAQQPRHVAPSSEDEQYRYLDSLFARTAEAFAADCFQTAKPSFQDFRVSEDGLKAVVIDTVAGWIVPFPVDQVTTALWESLTHVDDSKVCQSLRMDVETKDDTLVTSFNIVAVHVPDQGCTGSVLTRRYRTTDGDTVIVSITSGEMVGNTVGFEAGVTFLEEQFMRIRSVPSLVESEVGPVTQVQVKRQIRMTFPSDHTAARRNIVNAVIELMPLQVRDDIMRKREMVEGLMLHVLG
ncbi:hypothetical protein Poli38472_004922 [Pythium oligandrum]|uniref:Uncharacterized protein n=1 Tax=Pythium oligandrum TaxID=41045 RepID=A0A8K1CBB8_PYTOL|nr:hypothetical protein Poli38472_004922 [Pythium oligandrum]|eukprot:TMW59853.1 hypothetical protein Poli38472_004922 [Pythium oligandrum]